MTHRSSPESAEARKPCPFCGGSDLEPIHGGTAYCLTCKAEGPACDAYDWNHRAPAQCAPKPVGFSEAMDIVQQGFNTWRQKPHNKKWSNLIDGTPIPNDLMVNIAEAISHSSLTSTNGGGA